MAFPSRTSCSSAAGIATPRHLGLPGCRRHHRTHFRPCRWSIRIDHLRRAETRVRPVRVSSIPYSLSPRCPPTTTQNRRRRVPFHLKLILWTLFHRWKTETNKFRLAPWRIESIPTIVKLKDVRVLFILFLGLFHFWMYPMFPLHPRC